MNEFATGSTSWEESSSSESGSEASQDESEASQDESEASDCNVDRGLHPEGDLNRRRPTESVQGNSVEEHLSSASDNKSDLDVEDKNDDRQNKKFWEKNPEIYGIRRSSRARKGPERQLLINQSDSDSDSDEDLQTKHRRKKKQLNQSKRRHSNLWIPDLSSNSGTDSDVSPNVHHNGKAQQQRHGCRTISNQKSSVVKVLSKAEVRQTSRRAAAQVSYKEHSDNGTDSDDLLDVVNEETTTTEPAQLEMIDEDVETIEKILSHRLGRPGCIGAMTTCYAPEFERLSSLGDPDPENEATELQYLIKWKTWAYIHSTYETEESLTQQRVKGMKKLTNYNKRNEEIEIWKSNSAPEDVEYFECQQQLHQEIYNEYSVVERIIAHEYSGDNLSSYPDYLCKWQGLPYSECTWEDGCLVARFHQDIIDQYLNRESSSKIPNRHSKVLKQRPRFVPLKVQPKYIGRGRSLELRDYQLDGMNWLAHSWCQRNSVILADEMGLGKTIQSISFLLYLFSEHNLFGPFLIVVPLSTMAAWQKEFQLWAPDINVVVYIGDANSRNKIQTHEWCHKNKKLKFNAILTTYEMLLRDKGLLGSIYWSAVLVDEAHRLKNDDSLLYRILSDFKTNFRLLITGTPLQNSLKELWSLLHFIMPERFNKWEVFEAQYPITAMKDWYHKLHKELEPFLLRRVKKDVEKSLPAKVEQILRVEMSTVQRQYYKWILTKNFKSLLKGMKGNTNGFLNIVVELKKCCNHASLTRPLEENNSNRLQSIINGSGKAILLDKLLCRLKERGHRVLIFSQMVRMLDILAEYCTLKHFQFQRLDGGVRGELRKQAMDRFNAEGSNDFCFLLSTRAGGLGINLATADTVIIFDSDWNPQNDLQAMARAHRIGQRRQVNIYRLVTKASIEEDIIERAKKKMVLDHLIIQRMDTTGRKVLHKSSSAPSSTTPFNKEELAAILKFGAEELFKEDDEEKDKRLQEMSIDDILEMAETHDSDAHATSVGDELLSQFKVANLGVFKEDEKTEEEPGTNETTEESKTWEEIIPAKERIKLEMEEEQQRQLEMFLPPRQRKTLSRTKVDSKRQQRKANSPDQSLSDESDNNDDDNEKPKRKRGRPRTAKRDEIGGFTDSEIRRFIKSYKKFSRPSTRLDSIAADAELLEKSIADLQRLASLLHNGCKEAVDDYQEKLQKDPQFDGKKRGATFKLSSVTINAPALLRHEEELEPLAALIPTTDSECLKFRLAVPVRSVHWGRPWTVADDSMLLVGLSRHGFGNWEAIKEDISLGLSSKILVPGETKPTEKHLQSRAEYLIKLLRQNIPTSKPSSSSNTPHKVKSLKKANHVPPDEKPPDHVTNHVPLSSLGDKQNCGAENKQDLIVTENISKSVKKKKLKRPQGPEVSKNIDDNNKQHRHPKGETLDQKDVYEVSDMSRETFTLCKERMRPVKKALRLLENHDQQVSDKEQASVTRQCLLKIGHHVEKYLESNEAMKDEPVNAQWRSNLWTFVSKFTAFDARKLFSLFRIASKKKDTHRDEKQRHDDNHQSKQVLPTVSLHENSKKFVNQRHASYDSKERDRPSRSRTQDNFHSEKRHHRHDSRHRWDRSRSPRERTENGSADRSDDSSSYTNHKRRHHHTHSDYPGHRDSSHRNNHQFSRDKKLKS